MLSRKTAQVSGKRVEGLSARVVDGPVVSMPGHSYLRHMRAVDMRGGG